MSMIIILLVIFFMIGMDVKCAVNLDGGFAVVELCVLRTIVVGKFKVVLHNNKLYARRRGKPYKDVNIERKKNKSKDKPDMPRFKLYDLRITLNAGAEEGSLSGKLLFSTASIILNLIQTILAGVIDISGYDCTIYPVYGDATFKLNIYFNIKFSQIKIIIYLLRILLAKEEEEVKLNGDRTTLKEHN